MFRCDIVRACVRVLDFNAYKLRTRSLSVGVVPRSLQLLPNILDPSISASTTISSSVYRRSKLRVCTHNVSPLARNYSIV